MWGAVQTQRINGIKQNPGHSECFVGCKAPRHIGNRHIVVANKVSVYYDKKQLILYLHSHPAYMKPPAEGATYNCRPLTALGRTGNMP